MLVDKFGASLGVLLLSHPIDAAGDGLYFNGNFLMIKIYDSKVFLGKIKLKNFVFTIKVKVVAHQTIPIPTTTDKTAVQLTRKEV